MTVLEMLPSIGLASFAVFISSAAQVFLKKSALKQHRSRIAEYLNPYVILGYFMMFACTLMLIIAFRIIPLSLGAVLESASYIYVTIFGVLVFKEKLNAKKVVALLLILAGIFIFALGTTG